MLYVDLSLDEEALDGLTLDEQRALLGPRLQRLLDKGFGSRSAPWSAPQRSALKTTGDRLLSEVRWLP